MAKVHRFYSIKSLNSPVVHRFYGRRFTEGEPTACGVRVQKGWKFWPGQRTPKWLDISRDCKRCAVTSGNTEGKS